MVSHEGVSERTKHIDVKFHFVMKLKSSGEAEFPHISLSEMCADVFTKELSDDVYPKYAQVMQGLFKDA